VLVGMFGSGLTVWVASHAAFTGSSASPGNAWAAGQVVLSDDDSNSALFTATGLKPGMTGTKCIAVTYGGTVASGDVRIYGTNSTGTLSPYITMTIEMGSVGSFAGCGSFTASSTPVNSVAVSTIGTKTTYATGYSTGWSPAAGASRVFRFTYAMSASTPDSQESATCALSFTWETQT
jgi:hypothetical protein